MVITLHSKDGCPYCVHARNWFADRGVAITEIKWNNTAERTRMYATLSEKFGQRIATVPQIVVEEDGLENLIPGYTALIKSELAQRLATKLDDTDF
jgi:glutaredoxin